MRSHDWQPNRRHEQGTVHLGTLDPDRYLVFVASPDPRYALAGPVPFEVRPDATNAVVVRLRREVGFRIQLVHGDGSPVAHGKVELLHLLGAPPVTQTTFVNPLVGRPKGLTSATTQALLRATADTAEDGTAVLPAPAGESGLVLRVLPVECLGRVLHDVAIPQSQKEPFQIVVETACAIEGRVTPIDLVARLAAVAGTQGAGLALTADAGADRMRPPIGPPYQHAVGADGRFRIHGVPPGTWSIHLRWHSPPIDGMSSLPVFVPALATVTLVAGQTLELELDARAFTPATVRGRLLENGRPLAHTKWGLFPLEDPNRGYRISGPPTDKDGWFMAAAVMPGRYSVFALADQPSDGDRSKLKQAQQLLRVLPGDTLEQVFTIAPTVVVIRLTQADGTTAVPKRTIRWTSRQGPAWYTGKAATDDQGVARLDPAQFLPAEFYLREPELPDAEFAKLSPAEQAARTVHLGTVEPIPGQSEVQVRFRLPAR